MHSEASAMVKATIQEALQPLREEILSHNKEQDTLDVVLQILIAISTHP